MLSQRSNFESFYMDIETHFEPAWKQRGYKEMDKGQGREKWTEEWGT
jgi:hypothetical protein